MSVEGRSQREVSLEQDMKGRSEAGDTDDTYEGLLLGRKDEQ